MATDISSLAATPRPESGKGFARRLRMKGLVPAVCYGPFDKPLHVAVDPNALKKAIATPHKLNTVIKLETEGSAVKTVLLKSFDRDPVDGQVLHADFLEVRMDQDVDVGVPLVLTGKPVGSAEGGVLQQVLRSIRVRCKPDQIPEKIEVDVSGLGIAESLHVSDIKGQPAGIKFITGSKQTVAVVAIPEKLEEAVKPTVAVEGAAAVPGAPGAGTGAAAAPAEGAAAAPAKGGAAAPAAAAAGDKGAGKAPAKK